MGYTATILDDVRAQLAPDDLVLKEARARRDLVRSAAESFGGVLKSYPSGSLAHGTANCPIHLRDKGMDADCGVVLDRRTYHWLGPDSDSVEGPRDVVRSMVDHIAPIVRTSYPHSVFAITKRAIYIEFRDSMSGGEDPTVDLVVGLRRSGEGLWIPNTEKNHWDASHPEKHTDLFTAEPKSLRVTRARAVRLAKAENKRAVPSREAPVCSFNLEVLGWMFVQSGEGVPQALLRLWDEGGADLARRLTPDPAHLSAAIKVEDRAYAVDRLGSAAGELRSALEHDDDEFRVRVHLNRLWPDFVATVPSGDTKARIAARLQSGRALKISSVGALSSSAGTTLKSPRSFGTVGWDSVS